MAAQPHGSEFLLRRLQRASAIPAAERPPDVAAFVESVQLLREACDLLPLPSGGTPALQVGSTAARQQQATLALLKLVRADYLCPFAPVSDREVSRHLQTCWRDLLQFAGDPLITLLLEYSILQRASTVSSEMVSGTAAMLDRLADPAQQAVISVQLARLAAAYPGQPLLSFEQLYHACCCNVAQAMKWVHEPVPTLSHQAAGSERTAALAHRRASASLAQRVAAILLELEPDNPKSYDTAAVAGMTAVIAVGMPGAQHLLRSAELLTQGAQLARQQGNMFFLARCGSGAVMQSAHSAAAHPASWQAAVAAFEGAEAAVRTCRRLLPTPWADGLAANVQLAQEAIQLTQRQLPSQHSTSSAGPHILGLTGAINAAVASISSAGMCDGCGEEAVGLRRCARCKTAQYCSTECQRKHWRVHKRECREA